MKHHWSTKILSVALIVLLALAVLPTTSAYAATIYTSTGSGNWTDAIWSPVGTPGAGDTVTITHTVTLVGATQVDSLTINSGGTLTTGGYSLTVDVALSNSGTLNAGASTITLNGTFTNSGGTFSQGTSTVVFGKAGDQSIPGGFTYNNLSTSGSGIKTPVTFTVNGTLTVGSGTTLEIGAITIIANGATVVNGTLNFSSATGTKTFTGDVTINSGGNWNEAAAIIPTFSGSLQNGGTFNASTGIHTFNGASKTFSGANEIAIPKVTITSPGAYTNNGTLTVSTALTGTGSLTQGTSAAAILNIGGTSATITLTASGSNNTVNYDGGAAQTIKNIAYHHLIFSGSGAKTTSGTSLALTTIGGDFTISGAASAGTTTAALAVSGNLAIGSTAVTPLTVGGFAFTVGGSTTITDGILLHNNVTGAKTYTGDVTITSPGIWSETAAITPTFGGSLQNDGTFTASTGIHTFAGTGKTFSGANAIAIPSVTITGTYTNNGTLTVSTALTANGLTQGAGSTLNVGGTSAITTLDASTNANTVNYYKNGDQTVVPVTYSYLKLSGYIASPTTNIKTTTGVTVNGTLEMSKDALTTGNATASASLTYGGSAAIYYNRGSTALAVGAEWPATFAGSGGVTIGGTGIIYLNEAKAISAGSLTINAGAKLNTAPSATTIGFGLAASADITNNGTLTAVNSILAAGGNFTNSGTVTTATGSSITVAGNFTSSGAFTATGSTISIGGNLTLSGSTFTATSTVASTIAITGNFAVNAGATFTSTGATTLRSSITLSGDLTKLGTIASGGFNLTLNGVIAQSIADFTTTGAIAMTKTAGTATFMGNVTGGALTLNGAGTLNLGSGTHTFTGTWTRTNGALDASSSTLHLRGLTVSGTGGTFTAGTSTVIYDGSVGTAAAPQNVAGVTYYNLSTDTAGATRYYRALIGDVTVNNDLNIDTTSTLTIGAYNFTVTGATTIWSGGVLAHNSATGAKTYNGNVTVNSGGYWQDNAAVVPITFNGNLVNNGTFTAGTGVHTFTGTGKTLGASGKLLAIPNVTITGTYTNYGTLTVSTALSGGGSLIQDASASAILTIGGISDITTLDASGAGNTVNFTKAGAQTVNVSAYHHLGLSGGGIKTLPFGLTTINGNLTLTTSTTAATTVDNLTIGGNLVINTSTTFTIGAFNILVAGTTTVNGGLIHNSNPGSKRYTGAVTIGSATGKWTNSGDADINFRGGLTNNSTAVGSFTSGIGYYTFNFNPQTIGGTKVIAIFNLVVDGVALTNDNTGGLTLTSGGAFTTPNSGSLIQGASGILNVGMADISAAALDATANLNTVTYNGAAQTINATTYHHLTLSGSGVKTLTGLSTINGNLTIGGTAVATMSADVSVTGNVVISATTAVGTLNTSTFNLNVGGNWTKYTGTFASTGTGTVTLNGAGAQTIGGTLATTFNNLTINKSGGGVTLATVNTFVNGTLTLTSGKITTNTLTLVVNKDGTAVAGGSSTSYVIGNFRKVYTHGATTFKYPIGDTTGYRPLTLSAFVVTGTLDTGYVTATIPLTATTLEHSKVSTSGIEQTKDINRYWTLTPAGITYTGYDVKFEFDCSVSTQCDALVDPANKFAVKRYQNTTAPVGWTTPTLGTKTTTSIQATGLTVMGASSNFVVGELINTALAVTTVTDTYGNIVTLTATLTTSITPAGGAVVGRTVTFYLDGVSKGTAVTNASGVATLTGVALNTNAGTYLAATTPPTSGVSAAFAGDASYGLSVNNADLTVNQRPITVTATATLDTDHIKEYDGNVSSAGIPTVTNGTIATWIGDSDAGAWSQTFNSAAVATGKTLTPAGAVSDGNGGANYSVTFVNDTTGVINKKTVTVQNYTASNKVYDGTMTATLVAGVAPYLSGVVGGEDVTINTISGAFSNKNVGAGKAVTVSGTLTGVNVGNYQLGPISAMTADITVRAITLTANTATKTYDGNASSATLPTDTSGTLQVGDAPIDTISQSYDSAAASAIAGDKTLTPDPVNDGNGGNNYTLTVGGTATGTINKATITVTADNKVGYLGYVAPTYTYTPSGFASGESFATLVANDGGTAPICNTTLAFSSYGFGPHVGVIFCDGISGGTAGSIGFNTNYNSAITYVAGNLNIVIPASETYYSVGTYDGTISSAPDAAGLTFNVGDNSENVEYRGILHFNTSALPDTAVIVSATLKIKSASAASSSLGGLYVDIKKPFFGTIALASGDLTEAAGKTNATMFSIPAPVSANVWYSATLNTAAADAYIDKISPASTQFRLHFLNLNANHIAEFLQFYSGNAASANRPQLIINYYVP